MEGTVINTIACHNGSSISRQHNLRNRRITKNQKHIKSYNEDDPIEVKKQIEKLHETWLDIEPHKAYNELFSDAIKEYNDSQKRADRKINDYYHHINNSGNKEKKAYEMIAGVYKSQYVEGQKDRLQLLQTDEEKARNKIILKEFYEKFVSENKNLKVIGCYFHEDEEGSPHIHIDYIPFAHYEKGLKLRTSMSKAIEEMDKEQHFKTKGENPLHSWNKKQRMMLENICNKYNVDISHPVEHGIEKATQLTVREYKQKEIEKLDSIAKQNKLNIEEQEKSKVENSKTINEQCKIIDENIEVYNKNKQIIEKDINNKKIELKNINDKINDKNITYQKYKTAIGKQVEAFNTNKEILKNQISKIAEPSEKEIFDLFKENEKELYEDMKEFIQKSKEQELEKELPDVDDDFGVGGR